MDRTSFRVDFERSAFSRLSREAERLGIDVGDLLAIAAAVLVAGLSDSRQDAVRKALSARGSP